ncbi:hypothetical protein Tco_1037835 [Tanacetum coccineum]
MEMLSDAAILVADTKKAIKANKCDFQSQHQTGGSSEGAGSKPVVLDESKGKTKDTNEGSGSKPEVPDESKGKTKDTNEGASSKPEVLDVSKAMSSAQESENESWVKSEDNDDDDRKSDDERTKSDNDTSIDLNKSDSKEEPQGDEFVHTPDDYVPIDDETQDVDDKEYVCINEELYGDVNMEMKAAEPTDKNKGDEEMTDVEEVETEHKEINQEVASAKVKDKVPTTTTVAPATQKEKTEAPLSSSSCSVSSNYGSIFLNLENIYSIETEIMFMLDVHVQQEIPKIQSSSLLTVSVSIIHEPIVLSSITEIITEAHTTTISPFIPHSQQSTPIPTPTTTEATTSTLAVPESETLSTIHIRVLDLEKEVKELKNVDHSTTLLVTIKFEVLTTVKEYLGTSLGDALHKVLKRHSTEFIEEHFVPTDVIEVLKQHQKPHKSAADI